MYMGKEYRICFFLRFLLLNFRTVPTIAFFVFHFMRACVMLFGILNQGSLKKSKGWAGDGVRPRVCDICSCYNELLYKTPLI